MYSVDPAERWQMFFPVDNINLHQIGTDSAYDLKSRYENENYDGDMSDIDSPFHCHQCSYLQPDEVGKQVSEIQNPVTYFHLNCCGLSAHWEDFKNLLCDMQSDTFSFDFIGVSEVFRCEQDQRLALPGYHDLICRTRDDGYRGGVALFINESINYRIREDLSVFIPHVLESLFIEYESTNKKKHIVGVMYRPNTPPRADIEVFSKSVDDIMNIVSTEHKKCIIMGDMNIDLLKYDSQDKTKNYLNTIFSHGYLPCITKPTRKTDSTATLIDHIYSNDIVSPYYSSIVITDLADHFGTMHIVSTENASKTPKSQQYSRSFSKNNMLLFRSYLNATKFDGILNENCSCQAYDKFMLLYKNAYELAFPLRLIKSAKKGLKREPWMTQGLLISIRNKKKLFNKKLNKPSDQTTTKYKIYNSLLNKIKRKMKQMYYQKVLEENKLNIKKTWSIINQAMGKNNKRDKLPQTFRINDENVSDRHKLADSFNDFFSNIGHNISQNIPNSKNEFADYLPQNALNSIFLEPVDHAYILKIVKTLKPKLSSGHDGISTKLLKDTIDCITLPLTHIINRSLNSGIFPSQMKTAKVIPVFKSTDQTNINNYRPISLLPAFSKLLEKIMFDKTVNFLDANDQFYHHQYGFRAKHATIHPVIHFLNSCANANNSIPRQNTLAIFCDLSKAFDVINHNVLFYKLGRYGIRGVANDWFRSYLSNRKQYVEIEGIESPMRNLNCGVPQGSILGPLLFLIYVNDISNSSPNGSILSFADDTTLYMSDSNLTDLFYKTNVAITDLFNWFCSNKLKLNATKTKYILIGSQHNQHSQEGHNIFLNGIPLSPVGRSFEEKATKFLGLHIDDSLSWKQHISHVNAKMSRSLFAIKQVKHIFPTQCLRTLYFALVHPYLTYGILAWGNAGSVALHKTFMLQKRAIRAISKAAYNSHTDPIFKRLNILKVEDLYEYEVALFMHKYCNKCLPKSFDNCFKFNYDIQNTDRVSRQKHLFYIPRSNNKFSSALPIFNFPIIYNRWRQFFNYEQSLSAFKRSVRLILLSNYQDVVQCSNPYCKDCS